VLINLEARTKYNQYAEARNIGDGNWQFSPHLDNLWWATPSRAKKLEQPILEPGMLISYGFAGIPGYVSHCLSGVASV
jgi:hypothetical protein